MRFIFPLIIVAFATLSGCAIGPTPQNAQEFRDYINKGGYGTMKETYMVDTAYPKVVTVLKEKSKECLNKVLTETTCRGNIIKSCQDFNTTFTANLISKTNHSELIVRLTWPEGTPVLGGPPPKGGYYTMVSDIYPVGSGKTKITTYGGEKGKYSLFPRAVKHWANGSNLGCPDLTSEP